MKIQSVRIERFGACRQAELRDLAEDIQVFYGPNEAGKTTLLQFIRGMFYGLKDQQAFAPKENADEGTSAFGKNNANQTDHNGISADDTGSPELNGGITQNSSSKTSASDPERAFGGELTLSLTDSSAENRFSTLTIRRQGLYRTRPSNPDGSRLFSETFDLFDLQGHPIPKQRLTELLGGIDQNLYNHVFAMDLQDLCELSALNSTQASESLYQLSAQLPNLPLSEIQHRLQSKRLAILDQTPLDQIEAAAIAIDDQTIAVNRTGNAANTANVSGISSSGGTANNRNSNSGGNWASANNSVNANTRVSANNSVNSSNSANSSSPVNVNNSANSNRSANSNNSANSNSTSIAANASDLGGQITQMLRTQQQLEVQRDQIIQNQQNYSRISRQYSQTADEVARLDRQIKQLQEQVLILNLADKAFPVWKQRQELDQVLGEVADMDEVPTQKVEQLNNADADIARLDQQKSTLRPQWEQLRLQKQGMTYNRDAVAVSVQIRSFNDQKPWIQSVIQRREELRNGIAENRELITAQAQSIGLEGDPESWPIVTTEQFRYLRQAAGICKKNQASYLDIVRANQSLTARDDEFQARLLDQTLPFGNLPVNEIIDRYTHRLSQLREKKRLLSKQSELQQSDRLLRRQLHSLVTSQLMPLSLRLALNFITGMGTIGLLLWLMYLAGWISETGTLGSMGKTGVIFCFFGLAGVIIAKYLYEKSAEDRIIHCRRQWDSIQKQLQSLEARREKSEENLRLTTMPFPEAVIGQEDNDITNTQKEADQLDDLTIEQNQVEAQIVDLETRLKNLEDAILQDKNYRESQGERLSIENQIKAAQDAAYEAKKAWKRALREAGLPIEWTPAKLGAFEEQAQRIRELAAKLRLQREELSQKEQEISGFTSRVERMASTIGMNVSKNLSPLTLLTQIDAQLQTELENRRQYNKVRKELQTLERTYKKIVRQHREAVANRQSLLKQLGVEDKATLQRRMDLYGKTYRQRQQRLSLTLQLEQIIGKTCSEEALADALAGYSSVAELTQQKQTVRQSLEELTRQRDEFSRQAGGFKTRLRDLSDDQSVSLLTAQIALIDQQLQKAVRQWQVYATAEALIRNVYKQYETDRQPQVLQEASEFWTRMTEGQYTRVWTPLEQQCLKIDRYDGQVFSPDQLSSGTREQLYLSLRLALAACYARKGIRIPIVLDDVLVNFDSKRAAATIGVLREFASLGIQVLLFTCHEHIRDLFKRKDVIVLDGIMDRKPSSDQKIHSSRPTRSMALKSENASDQRMKRIPVRRTDPADNKRSTGIVVLPQNEPAKDTITEPDQHEVSTEESDKIDNTSIHDRQRTHASSEKTAKTRKKASQQKSSQQKSSRNKPSHEKSKPKKSKSNSSKYKPDKNNKSDKKKKSDSKKKWFEKLD